MKIRSLLIPFVTLILFSCKNERTGPLKDYTYSPEGYYYHLISFADSARKPDTSSILWLETTFRNQEDSVFWDSKHDASGKFFVRIADASKHPLVNHLLGMAEGDSMCFCLRTEDFYSFYFKTENIPFFSVKDSLVKANIKLKKVLDEDGAEAIYSGFVNEEETQVQSYIENAKNDAIYRDSSGIVWLEHKKTASETPHYGSVLNISYKGYFLDGKLIDNSNGNFTFTYGTPDQLLRGLNFVIKGMRKGEYAKIILPSCLAYGKSGSSNGSIPPFTPLLYEIHLTEVK